MLCLLIAVVGVTTMVRMPVDLFPNINIPVVVVATFYSGMPPEEIEANITNPFERWFTLGSGIDHLESRSLTGVSLIKIYFQPGTDADADVSEISNLAMADLRRLPPGTLPPVVLKFDASSLPVCLVTLKGEGLNETQLHDLGQFTVRNQLAIPGASIPQPFGGKYRQIQVYVDPVKLQAHELSVMDVVRTVNDANAILPAGDVRIGPKDYNIYTNSQLPTTQEINHLPLKVEGNSQVLVADVGHAQDAAAIQTNIVRVDGQKSVYLPILKQGGDSNTIAVVNGVRNALKDVIDIPRSLVTRVVFDQSVFVKTALKNLGNEGAIGLVLTALMILIFLGSMRATIAVLLSIPLSALAAFLCINAIGGSINTMVLGGLALAFSRLIDNSVVVLENIFRHMELGEPAEVAAEVGGREVALPVLAATFTTAIVFFPVLFLYGVSRFLFMALAAAVVFSLFASYMVAMTVVPLFCARFLKNAHGEAAHLDAHKSWFGRLVAAFNHRYNRMLMHYDVAVRKSLLRPVATILGCVGIFLFSLGFYPLLGVSFFPRTDPGQFVINVKAPAGTRVELTDRYINRVEDDIRQVVPDGDLGMIVSNIGITPDFSALYTSNSGQDSAFVQVSLKKERKIGSYQYMQRVRQKLADDLPELTTYLQAGGLVDSVVNMGLPAPIDIQVSGNNMEEAYKTASALAQKVRGMHEVSDVLIPQDLDYPGIQLNINREMAGRLGLSSREVVDNVITALTSNGMIAPSYWVDPKNGNNYLLTVQYPDTQVQNMQDLKSIPLRAHGNVNTAELDAVSDVKAINTPTEVDHFQLRRVIDVYVAPSGQDLGGLASKVEKVIDQTPHDENVRVTMRGSVEGMRQSFKSFGLGLVLSVVLVYLILMAQFASFTDPFIILLAIPPGITGVIVFLLITGTTLNVMSLMGVIMMTGIVVSNSILIVDVTRILRREGMPIKEAVSTACRMRLRPILMTSLATILGLIPMALALEAGSEQYAPLARAIIGGLAVSLVVTVFLVPAAYLLIHRREEQPEVTAS
jgi:multidrug efflux pump subunit AcrB